MGLYKLKKGAGMHQEVINGIVCDFVGGDTINTATELDKSFPGKFQRLDVEEMKTYQQPFIPIPARFIKSNVVDVDVDVEDLTDESLTELANEIDLELESRRFEVPKKFKKPDELPKLKDKVKKDK